MTDSTQLQYTQLHNKNNLNYYINKNFKKCKNYVKLNK